MGVVRINGDPICVVAMSPTGRQNLSLESLDTKNIEIMSCGHNLNDLVSIILTNYHLGIVTFISLFQ